MKPPPRNCRDVAAWAEAQRIYAEAAALHAAGRTKEAQEPQRDGTAAWLRALGRGTTLEARR